MAAACRVDRSPSLPSRRETLGQRGGLTLDFDLANQEWSAGSGWAGTKAQVKVCNSRDVTV